MESVGILDSTNEMHLFVLHFVFMPRIVRSLEDFQSQWNFHGIRTACSRSPLALWCSGIVSSCSCNLSPEDLYLYGIDYNDALNQSNDDDTGGGIIVPENAFVLTREQKHRLEINVDPLSDDGDSGIEHYIHACNLIEELFLQ